MLWAPGDAAAEDKDVTNEVVAEKGDKDVAKEAAAEEEASELPQRHTRTMASACAADEAGVSGASPRMKASILGEPGGVSGAARRRWARFGRWYQHRGLVCPGRHIGQARSMQPARRALLKSLGALERWMRLVAPFDLADVDHVARARTSFSPVVHEADVLAVGGARDVVVRELAATLLAVLAVPLAAAFVAVLLP
eukprot:14864681-Heterocapsa_arctica.AAC.1